jgi:hypothetical protein
LRKYGQLLIVKYSTAHKNKKNQTPIKQKEISFISEHVLLKWCQSIYIKEKEKMLGKLVKVQKLETAQVNSAKTRKESVPKVTLRDILLKPYKALDPFTTTGINARTAFKFQNWCCICGETNSKINPIESHHIRHFKKGKVSGFAHGKAVSEALLLIQIQDYLRLHQ